MLATWITLARLPLLGACLAILVPGDRLRSASSASPCSSSDSCSIRWMASWPVRARRRFSLGSVLDIAADRTYELSLWVTFAYLGLVPAVIPLIVLARTTLTDALRGLGSRRRHRAFRTAAQAAFARFLVASPWMRTGYSSAKVCSFCGLALAHACLGFPAESGLRDIVRPLPGRCERVLLR